MQWWIASVVVPIVIGTSSAIATHWLALRKTRHELRITERRKSYNRLLPALADVLAYHQRELLQLHGGGHGRQAEDAHAEDDQWSYRRMAAMEVIRDVIAKGELAASAGVIDALEIMMDQYSEIDPDTHGWSDACEALFEITLSAVDAVRGEVAREV